MAIFAKVNIPLGIECITYHLPATAYTNKDLVEKAHIPENLVNHRMPTGVTRRFIAASGETAADLGSFAAKKLLEKSKKKASDITLLITSTVTPPYFFPSTSALIQKDIGLSNATVFDVNASCSGGLYAMVIGMQFIERGLASYVLVVATDVATRAGDWASRRAGLFGDGAASLLLSSQGTTQIKGYGLGNDASFSDAAIFPALAYEDAFHDSGGARKRMTVDGKKVSEFAIKVLPRAVSETMRMCGKLISDIDLFIPYQVDHRLFTSLTSAIGISPDKSFYIGQEFGDTFSSSVLLALALAEEQKRLQEHMTIALVSFGAGMTWGVVVLET